MNVDLWREAFPNTLSDGKNIVCIFPDFKNSKRVEKCVFELGFEIAVYSFTTHVTLVDLETNEKIGQTEFVKIPDCPKGYVYSPGNREGNLRELRGGPATTEEVINWAKQRWSP